MNAYAIGVVAVMAIIALVSALMYGVVHLYRLHLQRKWDTCVSFSRAFGRLAGNLVLLAVLACGVWTTLVLFHVAATALGSAILAGLRNNL